MSNISFALAIYTLSNSSSFLNDRNRLFTDSAGNNDVCAGNFVS
ncbi:hypothetical protein [Chitinophaga sp. S165]|nr:hypothetical protein [Chitinophaga sp. S165]